MSPFITNSILTILCLPAISCIISGLFGRFLGAKGSFIITMFTQLLLLIEILIIASHMFINSTTQYAIIGNWFKVDVVNVNYDISMNVISLVQIIVVLIISTIVQFYSSKYMEADPHLPKFFSFISLFTFFMIVLLIADNFLFLFVGWEGVGICSYLLINYWHTRIAANKSAIKAIILNRIGDYGVTLALVYLCVYTGSVNFDLIFPIMKYNSDSSFLFFGCTLDYIHIIACALFVGAIGKSAQIGLHMWLPDAMEGPTPVSALIHAATMVTAGVFIMMKSSPLLEQVPSLVLIIGLLGGITSLLSALIGLVQYDIKRVIAFSTCSQLGYMFMACASSYYNVSIYHLVNHAFFKALLFLVAGAYIHSASNIQDMRKAGGLIRLLPLTFAVLSIGSFALIGFPFLSGFYSKDFIIEILLVNYTITGHAIYICSLFTAFITVAYSIRLIKYLFLTPSRIFKAKISSYHDLTVHFTIAFFFLILNSLFFGYIFRDLFIGLGSDFFSTAIYISPENYIAFDADFFSWISNFSDLSFSRYFEFYRFIEDRSQFLTWEQFLLFHHFSYNFTQSFFNPDFPLAVLILTAVFFQYIFEDHLNYWWSTIPFLIVKFVWKFLIFFSDKAFFDVFVIAFVNNNMRFFDAMARSSEFGALPWFRDLNHTLLTKVHNWNVKPATSFIWHWRFFFIASFIAYVISSYFF